MSNPTLRIALGEGAVLPEYKTEHSAGMDLRCVDAFTLYPGERRLIATGLKVAIPPGYEGQVRPRSGLALRHSIGIPNSPGTIDADYRGEIQVLLLNFGSEPYVVKRGDRVAQLVFARVARVTLETVPELTSTTRGDGGFGHSGR